MQLNAAGLFRATVQSKTVVESKNKLCGVACVFSCYEQKDVEGWVEIEPMEITGYFYIEKKDGSLNEINLDQLKNAFGWDGRDVFELQDMEFTEPVQIQTEFETYDGVERLKVKWLYSGDSTPGVQKLDDAARKSVQNRLGAKLRALAGASTVNPPKPTGAPKKPDAKPASKAPAKPGPTQDTAWDALCESMKGESDEKINEAWFALLRQVGKEKPVDRYTAADWKRCIELVEGPRETVTAGANGDTGGEDIPF